MRITVRTLTGPRSRKSARRRVLLLGGGVLDGWLLGMWVRAFAILVVAFAAPGTGEFTREVVTMVAGDECCDGACDDGRAGDCDDSCSHHGCCAHPTAIRTDAVALLRGVHLGAAAHPLSARSVGASGYHAPPFRPPSA